MKPAAEVIADADPDKIEAARQMTRAQKFIAGAELFDFASRITLAGMKKQKPAATRSELIELLRARLEAVDRWERQHVG